MINCYDDFCKELLSAGFTMGGGGNDEGVFALLTHSWNNQPPDSKIQWHTEDPQTDPWVWRIRVLEERSDIAYAKVFFKKSGYITKQWYPYFLAARRQGRTLAQMYNDGLVSQYAKRIYEVLQDGGAVPLHGIKQIAGFAKEDKSKFDRALIELQMGLFITMCGTRQKISARGEEYGWASTMFCKTEMFWGDDVFAAAKKITPQQAEQAITKQVLGLNPNAQHKKIVKFIYGK